jgi:L-rhamnonate dehydratase
MKIASIETLRLNQPQTAPRTAPRRASWWDQDEVANPMSRYPKVKRHRNLWLPKLESLWVRVTAEDGTSGLGYAEYGRVTAPLINEHLARIAWRPKSWPICCSG